MHNLQTLKKKKDVENRVFLLPEGMYHLKKRVANKLALNNTVKNIQILP